MTHHFKTWWLKTTTVLYFAHEFAIWVGLRREARLYSTFHWLVRLAWGPEEPLSRYVIRMTGKLILAVGWDLS